MKKIFIFILPILLIPIFSQVFYVKNAEATVGGPTSIHSFRYNPEDESVYYIVNDSGGRGCPPMLMKMSLSTGVHETVLSCDQGEKLLGNNFSEIEKIISDFKYLNLINLKTNKISVDIDFIKEETLSPDSEWTMRSIFKGQVYQDNIKVGELDLQGCNKEQPFLFDGYAIPGFEKKIVLLLSTKSDCFEGGYTGESLHVLGVNNIDKNTYVNAYKGSGLLVPNEGTLVVYEPDEIKSGVVETERVEGFSKIVVTVVAMLSLILGFVLG